MLEWEVGSSSREVSILGTLFCQGSGKCLQVSAPDHQQSQGSSALGSTAKHETAQELKMEFALLCILAGAFKVKQDLRAKKSFICNINQPGLRARLK